MVLYDAASAMQVSATQSEHVWNSFNANRLLYVQLTGLTTDCDTDSE